MPIAKPAADAHGQSLHHHGWVIVLTAVANFGLMGLHPHAGGQPLEMVQTLIRQGAYNSAVHGALMASYLVSIVGFLGLCHDLGRHRLSVQLAFVAYVASVFAAISAAVAAGFVMRSIAIGYASAGPEQVDLITNALRVTGAFNFAWGRIWMVALSAAILLWSIALVRLPDVLPRLLGALGMLLGGLSISGLIAGSIGLNVSAVLAMIAAQTAWSIGIGILLIRKNR